MDLYVVENHLRDGLVLIGDAFQTSSPPAGTGVSRLLVDVDRLCQVHLPGWMRSPGMHVDKISRYYDDPVKKAADRRAIKVAEYRRRLSTESSFGWTLHRIHHHLRRRVLHWLRGGERLQKV
jgi:2-polyprenyl-6-methoxyphenol hydroxylase-like FAD-dependent oxidoreductase